MGHDNCADKTGRNAPRGLVRVFKLVVAAGELYAESLCKAVPEIVGGACLQSLAVVHHSLDSVG